MGDNLPKRKNIRLREYNYSETGLYFITICTEERRKILSKIVRMDVPDDLRSHTAIFVGVGVLDDPRVELTEYGKIADKYIKQLNDHYENVSVEQYVIMPNHIHMILFVRPCGSSRTSTPTSRQHGTGPAFISTFKRFCNKEYGENIWQRYYYDHVIRDHRDYEKISEYIRDNPLHWQDDELYNEI